MNTYSFPSYFSNLSEKDARGKVLIIAGGIANFTNVAETFKGIVRALKQHRDKLLEHNVKIYVRRGGPNYQSGLQMMAACGDQTGLHIEVPNLNQEK